MAAKRSVSYNPISPVYQKQIASPYNFGRAEAEEKSNYASNLNSLGNSLADVGVAANKVSTLLATSDLKKKTNEVDRYYGKASTELIDYTGNLSLKKPGEGQNLFSDSVKYFEDLKKSYINKIQDPDVREAFESKYDDDIRSKLTHIKALELKNISEYEAQNKAIANQNAIKDLALTPFNLEAVAKAESITEENAKSSMVGYSGEAVKSAVDSAINNLHMSQIDILKTKSPSEALEYLDTHWDKVSPVNREEIKTDLTNLAKAEQARNIASKLANSGLPFEEQAKMLEAQIKDPEIKQAASKQIEGYEKEKNDLAELAVRQRYESEVDAIYNNPESYVVPLDLPAKQQNDLYNLREKLKDDAKAAKGIGTRVQTDFRVWEKLNNMPYDEFSKVKLTDYMGSLSVADLKDLSNKQKSQDNYAKAQTTVSYINNFVKSVVKEDFEKGSFLREAFETNLNKYPKEERGKVETLNKVKDSLLMPMDAEGNIFSRPAWKVMYDNRISGEQKKAQPADMPNWLPTKEAKWETRGGRAGWVYTDPSGKQVLQVGPNESYYINKE